MVNPLIEKLLDVMLCRAVEARLKAMKQENAQGFLEDMGLEINIPPANPTAPAVPQKRRYTRKAEKATKRRKYHRRGYHRKYGKRQEKDLGLEAARRHAQEIRTADDIE